MAISLIFDGGPGRICSVVAADVNCNDECKAQTNNQQYRLNVHRITDKVLGKQFTREFMLLKSILVIALRSA